MKKLLLVLVAALTMLVMGVAQAADRVLENKEYGIKATVPDTWRVDTTGNNIIAAENDKAMLQIYAPQKELNNITDLSQMDEEGLKGFANTMAEGYSQMGFKVLYQYGKWKDHHVLALQLEGESDGKSLKGVSYSMIRNKKHISVTLMGENEAANMQVLQKIMDSIEL